MKFIAAYIAGVLLGIPLVWFFTRKLGSSKEANLGGHLLRIALRCLALALAFAPVTFTAGYVGLVLPASAVLGSSLASPAQDRTNHGVQNQIVWSITSLIFCWVASSAIYGAAFLCKRAKQEASQKEGGVGANPTMGVCASFWGLAIFVILLLATMCFLGPCSSQDG